MSNLAYIVKDEFQAQFYCMTLSSLENVKNNDKDTKSLIFQKWRRAIIDAKKKTVKDYDFDSFNKNVIAYLA